MYGRHAGIVLPTVKRTGVVGLERVERRTRIIGGTRWDITITHRHNPVAHRDAQAMFIGMIVQQLMDDMTKRVEEAIG